MCLSDLLDHGAIAVAVGYLAFLFAVLQSANGARARVEELTEASTDRSDARRWNAARALADYNNGIAAFVLISLLLLCFMGSLATIVALPSKIRLLDIDNDKKFASALFWTIIYIVELTFTVVLLWVTFVRERRTVFRKCEWSKGNGIWEESGRASWKLRYLSVTDIHNAIKLK